MRWTRPDLKYWICNPRSSRWPCNSSESGRISPPSWMPGASRPSIASQEGYTFGHESHENNHIGRRQILVLRTGAAAFEARAFGPADSIAAEVHGPEVGHSRQ